MSASLWLCFAAQMISVVGDSFGQRSSRVFHGQSRRRFILALSFVSSIETFVILSFFQLAEASYTLDLWVRHAEGDVVNMCTLATPECYYQGPLTIPRALASCPSLFFNQIINLFYYLGEASLYTQPMGLLLIVMAAMSSTFIIAPLQHWLHVGTTTSIPLAVTLLGVTGVAFSVVERPPRKSEYECIEEGDSVADDVGGANSDQPGQGSSASSCLATYFPMLLPFLMLSASYAVYFILQRYYSDTCRLNPWGYNSFDQVTLPPFVFGMFWVAGFFPTITCSEGRTEGVWESWTKTWKELTKNRCAGLINCAVYRFLTNGRAMIYTYLAVLYDLNAVYLQLTLIRVTLSWLGSLVLVLVFPSFIQTTPEERRAILDPSSVIPKVGGSGLIIMALIAMPS